MSNTNKAPSIRSPRYVPKLKGIAYSRQLGFIAGRSIKSLRDMPYGPGERQKAYIEGFFAAICSPPVP